MIVWMSEGEQVLAIKIRLKRKNKTKLDYIQARNTNNATNNVKNDETATPINLS